MTFLERIIVWLVALTMVLALSTGILNFALVNLLGFQSIIIVITLLRVFIVLLILLFQMKHFGIRVLNKACMKFFLLYSFYILLYLTIFRIYPIEELSGVPDSVGSYIVNSFFLLGLLISADTIVRYFNIRYFLILSLLFCVLPSFFVLQYIGVDVIQEVGIKRDEQGISPLSFGFTNSPILLVSLFYFHKLFKSKHLSIVFNIVIVLLCSYIIVMAGERGPMLWTIVAIFIYLSLKNKIKVKYYLLVFVFGVIIYIGRFAIISELKNYVPRTAERIEMTIVEGYTSGRFDLDRPDQSTFFIGLQNFAESPLFGYYFRLVTNYYEFKGSYVHNIFLEILMTMGLLGFIPFVYLLLMVYKNSKRSLKGNNNEKLHPFLLIFLSSFFLLVTSGTLLLYYNFWLSFYVLCSTDKVGRLSKRPLISKVSKY